MIKAAILCFGAALALAGSANAAVVISSAATKHMNCSAGVCSPTAANAVLNTGDLAAMLGSSDVKVTTGAGAISIGVTSPLSWGSSDRLTLDAQQSVAIRSTVIVEGTGGLTVAINDGGSGGDLNIYPGGSVTFWDTAGSLIVNGNSYTLVNDIATLAADIAANPAGFYALARDYDASVDGTYHAAPVQTIFAGTMEGLGHVISNLTIAANTTKTYVGLFAVLKINPTIRDIGLENVSVSAPHDIKGKGYVLGSLVGEFLYGYNGGGSIINAYGSVTGGIFTGGLVGYTVGNTIGHSHCDCSVSGYGDVGGLAGRAINLRIQNSYTSGSVTVTYQYGDNKGIAGGLLGSGELISSTQGTTVVGSHSTANVSNPYGDAGGLVGLIQGTVGTSYATGAVNVVLGLSGGLVAENDGTIADSYATGAMSVNDSASGGLVGWNKGTVSRSFATGSVTGGFDQCNLGGLAGYNTGTIQMVYATGSVSRSVTESQSDCGLGGLVAGNDGTIQTAYATGAVSNAVGPLATAGGLVASNQGSISNAYALGSVEGNSTAIIGGLVGSQSSGGIASTYSIGAVAGSPNYTGGSIGRYFAGTIDSDYWDINTSGTKRSAGGTGLRSYELKSGLPPGFDSAIWGQRHTINNGYPYLFANPPQ